ncbi:MAG: bifunctional nuclease family protein [Thermodesulfovibrionales bacterium]
MFVEMKVEGLLFDPRSNMYILLLKETEGAGTLPIWIGKPEADSIALALGKVATPRPLTHDLITNIVSGLKVKIIKVVVTEIIDNTYYALITITDGTRETLIDSRPSDAVAVALRANVPIFVESSIMSTRTDDDLDEWLKNLKPEDFGNIM